MSQPILKLITTEDGSHSLFREDLDETYHSSHGARGESEHVFIKMGLEYLLETFSKKSIQIFEVGLGTGLNALLAALFGLKHNIKIDFHSIEPIPVQHDIYSKLNFGTDKGSKHFLDQIHESKWETTEQISEGFSLTKYKSTLEAFSVQEPLSEKFDIVFFDAFGPSKQPEVWHLENIQKCFSLLQPSGILTCYSAQGQFKRNLKSAGFEIEGLPGAMGKREMTRAKKPLSL
ncbi:MAG: tRNA (5-methylaminomethyl-2-thiouridine)(34)-methyltransferase MnmD [Cyclobacteriaceae bacterium]